MDSEQPTSQPVFSYGFSLEQQKVLQALSDTRYKWRAKRGLQKATGLSGATLDDTLANLLKRGLVRPAFSTQQNIVFGLRERVE